MSYLAPFSAALLPKDQILYRAFILNDEPGIPDDTYQLQEWFCPNPTCHCNDVHIKVLAEKQNLWVLNIHLHFDLQRPPAPTLELDDDSPVYANKLFKLIASNLADDPAFVQRLYDHYQTLKSVAADPSHPCYNALLHWGKTGQPPKPSSKKRRRKN